MGRAKKNSYKGADPTAQKAIAHVMRQARRRKEKSRSLPQDKKSQPD